jgi:hypothetical protein
LFTLILPSAPFFLSGDPSTSTFEALFLLNFSISFFVCFHLVNNHNDECEGENPSCQNNIISSIPDLLVLFQTNQQTLSLSLFCFFFCFCFIIIIIIIIIITILAYINFLVSISYEWKASVAKTAFCFLLFFFRFFFSFVLLFVVDFFRSLSRNSSPFYFSSFSTSTNFFPFFFDNKERVFICYIEACFFASFSFFLFFVCFLFLFCLCFFFLSFFIFFFFNFFSP